MLVRQIVIILLGIATIYGETPDWEGRPLYCDRDGSLIYGRSLAKTIKWVALDIRLYESGVVKCGDRVRVTLDNGTTIDALALDAGPFEGFFFMGGPVVVDVPAVVLDEMNVPYYGVKWSRVEINPGGKYILKP